MPRAGRETSARRRAGSGRRPRCARRFVSAASGARPLRLLLGDSAHRRAPLTVPLEHPRTTASTARQRGGRGERRARSGRRGRATPRARRATPTRPRSARSRAQALVGSGRARIAATRPRSATRSAAMSATTRNESVTGRPPPPPCANAALRPGIDGLRGVAAESAATADRGRSAVDPPGGSAGLSASRGAPLPCPPVRLGDLPPAFLSVRPLHFSMPTVEPAHPIKAASPNARRRRRLPFRARRSGAASARASRR